MSVKRVFVGRKDYLEDFDEFINTSSSNLDGQVLLVVGEQGMGKTALLQAMAKRAITQDHVVALSEVDKRQSEFSEQIYPIIAQIKTKAKLKIGKGSDWLKAGLTGFAVAAGVATGGTTAALFGGATGLGGILIDIRNRHKASGSSPLTLAELFHDELAKSDQTIGGAIRIVIFLDPEKESPVDIIPLLRQIAGREMPSRVRFIIAQRNKDTVIQAQEDGELRGICCEPMRLDLLPGNEETQFIKAYDKIERLNDDVRAGLINKFKGWPLLLNLAISQLLKVEGDITIDDVNSLPSDIDGLWKQRYEDINNENSLRLVQTACLLPHPYSINRLSRFAGLQPSAMASTMNDPSVWQILEKVSYEDTLSHKLWYELPYPKHATVRDFVSGEVEKFKELKNELLGRIVLHYKEIIGDFLEGEGIDRDALVNLPNYIAKLEDWGDFIKAVNKIYPVKHRYGLLESCVTDLSMGIEQSIELKHIDYINAFTVNLGNIYKIRGDLYRAEEMYLKILGICERGADKKGLAIIYSNLGGIYKTRSEYPKAKTMLRKSMEILKTINDMKDLEASNYVNLGDLFQLQGHLKEAKKLHFKALEIYVALDNKEGIANAYSNLGIIYSKLDKLDKAEGMLLNALKINKDIGYIQGIAKSYDILGVIYCKRNKFRKAEEMHQNALEINKPIGEKELEASCYNHLGYVHYLQSNYAKSEGMYLKSLEIANVLKNKGLMASDYNNLANVYNNLGDLNKAKEMWQRSLKLYGEIGDNSKAEEIKNCLDELTKSEN